MGRKRFVRKHSVRTQLVRKCFLRKLLVRKCSVRKRSVRKRFVSDSKNETLITAFWSLESYCFTKIREEFFL